MLILMAISSMKLFRIQWLRMRKKQCKEVIHNKVVIMMFTMCMAGNMKSPHTAWQTENIKVSSTVKLLWTTFSNHRNISVTEVGLSLLPFRLGFPFRPYRPGSGMSVRSSMRVRMGAAVREAWAAWMFSVSSGSGGPPLYHQSGILGKRAA